MTKKLPTLFWFLCSLLICAGLVVNNPSEEAVAPTPAAPAIVAQATAETPLPSKPVVSRDKTPPHTSPTIASPIAKHPGTPEIMKERVAKQSDQLISKNGRTYPLRTYKTMLTPNDPLASQWWVAPNGMTNVWDVPAGARQTKIAIIDTGFALNHQEFAGRWAINGGENGPVATEAASKLNCTDQSLPLTKSCNNIDDNFDGIVDNETGFADRQNPSRLNCTAQSFAVNKSCNRIDDDGNGYIDDVRGWDFANYDSVAAAGETNPAGPGTDHGTMVAGVLGASGNNGVGMAGVNWHTSILPIQALDDDGYGDSLTVAESVRYAADQGADIISISLGTSSDDPYMREAILYALDKGSVVVAAVGNDGCNCMSYPANYPEVIAVGATNPSGAPASFSSYGAQLDLLAPGQGMTSPTWATGNQTSAYASNIAGTSFATPFVSGLLGLARMSQPDAAWEELIGSMLEKSDRRTLTATSPHSDTLGYGVTRADTMLARLRTPTSAPLRYQFGGGIVGSEKAYQCENGAIPATGLYELAKSGSYRYTANMREVSKLAQQGWTSRRAANVCMGLATDTVAILRVIDLPSEIRNVRQKL